MLDVGMIAEIIVPPYDRYIGRADCITVTEMLALD